MNDITPHTSTETGDSGDCSLAPDRNSSFAQKQATRCLCGALSSTDQANAALTAPFSVMSRRIDRAASFDKLTQSLMRSGLVAGITHTSGLTLSGQQILDFASCKQAGDD